MDKFLAHDSETGGLDPTRHSLLTYYAGIYTFDMQAKKFSLCAELDLKLKPSSGDYCVTAEAMGVNKIDLAKHDKEAITYEEGGEKLYYFLKQNSDDGRNRLIRMGHNEPFDRDMVINFLLKLIVFQRFTDYGGVMDSMTMARERKVTGRLPWNTRFRLATLAEFLGVPIDPKLVHTAKGDVDLCVRCIEKMLTV